MAVSRYPAAESGTPAWDECSAERPCPACGAPAACTYTDDAGFARCHTTVSIWPVLGGGWLHALAEDAPRELAPSPHPVPSEAA